MLQFNKSRISPLQGLEQMPYASFAVPLVYCAEAFQCIYWDKGIEIELAFDYLCTKKLYRVED